MPRTARASVGGVCYHVINRGNAGAKVFRRDADFDAFLELLKLAHERLPMRVLAYCLMADHFHLVLWPRADEDLSRWMQWLLTSHVRRYHGRHHTSGHVWQGRFKAFPIQRDDHLLTVLRYVEANPLRARLVRRAENWPWSSAAWWGMTDRPEFLHSGPVERPRAWLALVNRPMTQADLEALRRIVNRGTPFGDPTWQSRTAKRLGLESTLRPRGRPRSKP
ncbi:MAG: transposase [Planctomycetota bacterium]